MGNVPKNPLYMGLDRADYIWILSGELSLFYLAPGAKRFEMAEPDVAAAGYPDPTGCSHTMLMGSSSPANRGDHEARRKLVAHRLIPC